MSKRTERRHSSAALEDTRHITTIIHVAGPWFHALKDGATRRYTTSVEDFVGSLLEDALKVSVEHVRVVRWVQDASHDYVEVALTFTREMFVRLESASLRAQSKLEPFLVFPLFWYAELRRINDQSEVPVADELRLPGSRAPRVKPKSR